MEDIPSNTPFLRDMIPPEIIGSLPLVDGKLSSSLMNQVICTALRMAAIKHRDDYCSTFHQPILDSSYSAIDSCTKDISIDALIKSRTHILENNQS